MNIDGKTVPRTSLSARIGHQAQLGGTRHIILGDGPAKGTAAIDVDTGAGGLSFTVVTDRGMDISRCSYRGVNLVYLTPNGEVHPAFYEPAGIGWLHTFFGGLLTTCGLTYLGHPGRDGDQDLGLHGRYSTIPAQRVQDRSGWDGDRYRIELVGTVEECMLFGDKLRLTRTIRSEVGSRTLTIDDRVENIGYNPSPFTILYHINVGYPLLDAGAELCLSAAKTEPHDEQSRAGMPDLRRFSAPVPGFAEENYLHTMAPEADGLACAAVVNPTLAGGLGLRIRFDPRQLPYLNEWKMMGQGDYVVAIEPCNVPCRNRAELRRDGLLPMLPPGEVRVMRVEVSVLEGQAEIDACRTACRC